LTRKVAVKMSGNSISQCLANLAKNPNNTILCNVLFNLGCLELGPDGNCENATPAKTKTATGQDCDNCVIRLVNKHTSYLHPNGKDDSDTSYYTTLKNTLCEPQQEGIKDQLSANLYFGEHSRAYLDKLGHAAGLDSVVVIYSVVAVALLILLAVFWYTRNIYIEWKKLKDAGKMDWLDDEKNQGWFERGFLWLMQLGQNQRT